MHGATISATGSRVFDSQLALHGDVEQVAQRPPVVITEGKAALQLTGTAGAAVINAGTEAKWQGLLMAYHHIRKPRFLRGLDVDVGFRSGYALVVF